jgi:hypothetical protein
VVEHTPPALDSQPTLILREVEVSITAKCTLACDQCGFFVPTQPAPSNGDSVDELSGSLGHLRRLGIHVEDLAILGGEPTINRRLLERAACAFRDLGVADRLEVVTNGLTPQGLSLRALKAIDRLVISVYGLEDALLARWESWLKTVAPHVEMRFRRNEGGWDRWTDLVTVDEATARRIYDDCWYRRHCITVERGRLFACSRIPKMGRDEEGLPLDATTTVGAVQSFLSRDAPLPSCFDCTPMVGLPTVPAGVQPDDRIVRLQRRAIEWLDAALAGAVTQ